MINVSNQFLETMQDRTDFMESATITFANGLELELSGDDFTLSNNYLSDSAGTSNFPLGVAVEKVIQIEIFNKDDYLWGYDFFGAKIRLRLSFELSNSTETIDYGTYTVTTPETYGTTVIVQATDDMYKADEQYETNLTFPATLREIVQEVCNKTNIYLLTTTFNNDSFKVLEAPEDVTYRQVIAMAAMIACGYARMDFSNRLCITSYDISMFDYTDGLDGGYFDNPNIAEDGEIDGGYFDIADDDLGPCAAIIKRDNYSASMYTDQNFSAGKYEIEIQAATNVGEESFTSLTFGLTDDFTALSASSETVEMATGGLEGTKWTTIKTSFESSESLRYFVIANTSDYEDPITVYIKEIKISLNGNVIYDINFNNGSCPDDWKADVPIDSSNMVEFLTGDASSYRSGEDASGGSFEPWNNGDDISGGAPTRYISGDNSDGGSFNPWDEGDILDGGRFADMDNYHVLHNFTPSGLKLEVDDVVITGFQADDAEDDDVTYQYGEDGYVLKVDNKLIAGKEEEALSLMGAALIGLRFRPFEGDHIAYPIAEYGDLAVVSDFKGRVYQTLLTDVDFSFRGYTTFKCSAESPLRNSASYNSNSDYVKAVKEARKLVEDKITEYDKAIQKLAELMANSFGVFTTEEVLEDGSRIFYLHNKPTLDASDTIWKMTADAFSVSTDGGKTWNAGIDSGGNVVANVLSVIGINFDWAHGGTLTLGGYNNDYGWMKILNSSGSQIGKWDKDGIQIVGGSITVGSNFAVSTSGAVTENSGYVGGWNITSTRIRSSSSVSIGGSEAGLLLINEENKPYLDAENGSKTTFKIDRDGNATFAGKLSAATGTFSGSLSAATGTFAGTLSAVTGTFTSIYTNSHSSYSSTSNGFYAGTDGLSLGKYFSVSKTGEMTCKSGTFSGTLSAATGTFAGDISAASGTFTGSVSSTSGNYNVKLTSGRVYLYHGSSLSGYVGGTSTSSAGYGVRVAGVGHVILYSNIFGVGSYTSPTSGGTYTSGETGSTTVIDSITSQSGGGISWHYHTMTFRKGLCTSI